MFMYINSLASMDIRVTSTIAPFQCGCVMDRTVTTGGTNGQRPTGTILLGSWRLGGHFGTKLLGNLVGGCGER